MRYAIYTYNVINSPAGRSYLQHPISSTDNITPHKEKKANSPQRRRSKTQRTPDIHRILQDVERETFHAVVHQDPKVISEERPGDTERVGRGDHKQLTGGEERDGHGGREGLGEEPDAGLVGQCELVSGRVSRVRRRR